MTGEPFRSRTFTPIAPADRPRKTRRGVRVVVTDGSAVLMFADTDQAAKATRDPVAPAKRSAAAQRKAQSKVIDDGQPAHSFATLMAEMATIVRNTCRTPSADPDAPTFELLTTATAHQQRALALIQAIRP